METDGTILLPQYVVSTNPNTYCKATSSSSLSAKLGHAALLHWKKTKLAEIF